MQDMLMSSGESMSLGIQIALSGNFALSILLGGSLEQLWGMVRLLQVMLLQAMMSISYTSELTMFYQYCVLISEIDIMRGP